MRRKPRAPHAQLRYLPPGKHNDAAHQAITQHLVRCTLQCRGGGPVPRELILPAALVLGAIVLSLLCILGPALARLATWR